MLIKRTTQLILVLALLATSFAFAGRVEAWGGCSTYITVQWGDTLSGLAYTCGTTVAAIRAANPGLGWWVYAGQVLYMPSGYTYTAPAYYAPSYGYAAPYGGTYVVQWGDTLRIIAARYGTTVYQLQVLNPQIYNPNWIYAGQVIRVW